MASKKQNRRKKIKQRIRKTVYGTTEIPRLTVFRSNNQIYVQLIDDVAGHTIIAASSQKDKNAQKIPKIDQAKITGKSIADKAIKMGITKVVFDRNGYLYHGRVKSLAEAAREAGLKF